MEGKRKVEEAEGTKEELVARPAAAESEVGWLSAAMGTLREEKADVEAKVTGVEMEMDLLRGKLQEAKGSMQALKSQL